MKQVVNKLMLILVLCLTLVGTHATALAQTTYALTPNGVGPVQLGVKAIELPESVPQLYDSKVSDVYIDEEMPDDEDMPEFATWYFYDEEGETVFTATQDSLGYICEINICSPKILTPEGIHVGMPQRQLDAIKGAQRIDPDPMADYGRLSYVLNGVTYWVDEFYIDDNHSEDRVASITVSNPVLNQEGIGPVRLGIKASDLPESAPLLYASKVLGDGKTPPNGKTNDWHFFDDKGKELFTAKQDGDGVISEITITDPSISTYLGIHVGMPMQQVEYISGLQFPKPTATNDSYNCYDVFDITLNVNKPQSQNTDYATSLVASMSIPGLTDIIAQNVADTHNKIIVYFNQNNTLNELAQHIEEIRQMPQVEDVYTNDETTMFVKYKEISTFTYSYFPIQSQNNYQVFGNIPRYHNKNWDFKNLVIANQHSRDRNHDDKNRVITETVLLFKQCGLSQNDIRIVNPTLRFFIEDIFDYDIVFLMTHGIYDKKTGLHWLFTSEEINEGDVITKEQVKMFMSYSLGHDVEIDGTKLAKVSSTTKEKRIDKDGNEAEINVTYVGVSEKYIETSNSKSNQFAILFNSACHSLEGKDEKGFTLASTLQSKRPFLYIGYDNENSVGDQAGLEFFSRILSGLSLQQAFESISSDVKEDCGAHIKAVYPASGIENVFVMAPLVFGGGGDAGSLSEDGQFVAVHLIGHSFLQHKYSMDKRAYWYNEKNQINSIIKNPSAVAFLPFRYGFEISKTDNFNKSETRTILFEELDEDEWDVNTGQYKFIRHLKFPASANYWDKANSQIYVRSFIYLKGDENNRNYSTMSTCNWPIATVKDNIFKLLYNNCH